MPVDQREINAIKEKNEDFMPTENEKKRIRNKNKIKLKTKTQDRNRNKNAYKIKTQFCINMEERNSHNKWSKSAQHG